MVKIERKFASTFCKSKLEFTSKTSLLAGQSKLPTSSTNWFSASQEIALAKKALTCSKTTSGSPISTGNLSYQSAWRLLLFLPSTRIISMRNTQTVNGKMPIQRLWFSTKPSSIDQASRSFSKATITMKTWRKCSKERDLRTLMINPELRRLRLVTAPLLVVTSSRAAHPKLEVNRIIAPACTEITPKVATMPNPKTFQTSVEYKTLASPKVAKCQGRAISTTSSGQSHMRSQAACICLRVVLAPRQRTSTVHITNIHQNTNQMLLKCTLQMVGSYQTQMLCQLKTCN